MAKRKKAPELPPISEARLAAFKQGKVADEHIAVVHAQLCNATQAEREQWAKAYDIPIHDDLDAWGNAIIVAHAERVDRAMAALTRALQATADMQADLKERAMVYQYSLKCEVADARGLTFDQVNLPYPQWAAIRDEYLTEKSQASLTS